MRNSDDISDDEYRARIKKVNSLSQHPYSKACREKLKEIFGNSDFHEWKNENGKLIYTLKNKFKEETDSINRRMNLFRMAKFPELVFDIEDDIKLKEVDELKSDKQYDKLIKGISYHSDDIYEDDNAIAEIEKLVDEILTFIESNYSTLFPK